MRGVYAVPGALQGVQRCGTTGSDAGVATGLNGNAVRRVGLAGTWFGTELRAGASHCLVGCTVAPGFDFADFELAQGPELESRYPAAGDRIRRMSRS
jgi:predicted cupin superfamily sugar epimerase